MIRREIIVKSPEGLQSRSAALLVRTTCRYQSRIVIERADKVINAKSMMGVLSLGVASGQRVFVVAEGPDEEQAADALVHLAERGFQEA